MVLLQVLSRLVFGTFLFQTSLFSAAFAFNNSTASASGCLLLANEVCQYLLEAYGEFFQREQPCIHNLLRACVGDNDVNNEIWTRNWFEPDQKGSLNMFIDKETSLNWLWNETVTSYNQSDLVSLEQVSETQEEILPINQSAINHGNRTLEQFIAYLLNASVYETIINVSRNYCVSSTPEIATNFEGCFCNGTCSPNEIQFFSRSIASYLYTFYLANNTDAMGGVSEQLEKLIFCRKDVGCCYRSFSYLPTPRHDMYLSGMIPSNCFPGCLEQSIAEQSIVDSNANRLLRDCLEQINANIPTAAQNEEAVQFYEIISSRPSNQGSGSSVISSSSHRLIYRLAFSQLSLEHNSGLLFRLYPLLCSAWACSAFHVPHPSASLNINPHHSASLSIDAHSSALVHDHWILIQKLSVFTELGISLGILVAMLNVAVFVLLFYRQRKRKDKDSMSHQAHVLLLNICFASFLFAASDMASILLNFYGQCFGYNNRLNTNANLKDAFCCHETRTTLIEWYGSENEPYLLYTISVLKLITSSCQFASIFLFLLFATVQVFPLVWPNTCQRYSKCPCLSIVICWTLAFVMASLANVPQAVEYERLRNIIKRQGEILYPDKSIETQTDFNFTNHKLRLQEDLHQELENASHSGALLAASLIEVVVYLVLFYGGELIFVFIFALVLKIHWSRPRPPAGNQETSRTRNHTKSSRSSRSRWAIFGIGTLGLCMTALLVSVLPTLVLMIQVIGFKSIDQLSQKDIFGAQVVSDQVDNYFMARFSMLLGPIVSPILIVIQYETLTASFKSKISSAHNPRR